MSNNIYLQSIVVGPLGILGSLPFTHPLDFLKSKQQLEKGRISYSIIATTIFKEKGWTGLYAGLVPKSLQGLVKQGYRLPLQIEFDFFFNRLFQTSGKEHRYLSSVCTGGVLTFVDTFVICPTDRLKLLLMTRLNKEKRPLLTTKSSSGVFRELFTGLGAVSIKQGVSWMTFLLAEEKGRNFALQFTKQEQLSFPALMGVSAFVGSINTLFVHPWDVVKTLHQKNRPLRLGVWATIKTLFKEQGLRGTYAGWEARLLQYVIQSCFTVSTFEYFRNKRKNLN